MDDPAIQLNNTLRRLAARQGIALAEPDDQEGLLTDLLLADSRIDRQSAAGLIEAASGAPFIDPAYISFAPEFLAHARLLIPRDIALRERAFPIRQEGNSLHLIMANPLDSESRARLEARTGCRLHVYCCHGKGIDLAIASHYAPDESSTDDKKRLVDTALQALSNIDHPEAADLGMAWATNAHIILLVQDLLRELAASGTSDIHIEPQRTSLRLRVRRDGVLHTVRQLPVSLTKAIITRLKLMARLDLEATHRPQDGRIDYQVIAGRDVDIRMSCLPSLYGENIVLRILDKGARRITLEAMDLPEDTLGKVQASIRRPNGLVLVTGPTGSGKTSTLYACLEEINREEIKISTVEDPIEYEMAGVVQINCGESTGLTFIEVLRALLRQDPDVLMIGEIRDHETADVAVKAAATGHLVLATMHTNDAPSAAVRLINLGVPPFLVASCGLSVIAQRLLRRICPDCAAETTPEPEIWKRLGVEARESGILKGVGCGKCEGTGYLGRLAVLEILTTSDRLEQLILEKRSAGELRRAAVEQGMTTLSQAALQRLLRGQTTPEEVLRLSLDI